MRIFFTSLLFIALTAFCSCKKEKEHTHAVMQDITESVYASGFVKAQGQYQLFSPVNGLIKKIVVNAGDSVSIGDELIYIENLQASLGSDNARIALNLAMDNLNSQHGIIKEMENNVQVAKEKFLMDSTLFASQQRLNIENIGSKVELEQKKIAFMASKTAYQAAKDKLVMTKKQLESEIKRAENNLKISQKQAGDFIIKSEVSGRVYAINKEVGEVVNAQTPIGVLGSDNDFYIELHVDEFDIVKLKKGQQVYITMDSYKGEVFEAEIVKIDPMMSANTRSFNVRAHFTKGPKVMYPNLSVQANITIQKKNRVITIPSKYLMEGNKVVLEKNKTKEVKIGLQDYLNTEIISGLDTSETIYLPRQ